MQLPHFHITATGDDGTRANHTEGAYLPALELARRPVQEARLPGGTVTYDPMTGDAPFCIGLWLVRDAQATATASIAISGACYGTHADVEVMVQDAALRCAVLPVCAKAATCRAPGC